MITSTLALSVTELKHFDATTCEQLKTQLSLLGEQVPDGVPFQNELVNLKINELNLTGNIQVVNGTIVGVDCGLSNNSTYALELENLSNINDLVLSDDPVATYLQLKDEGAVKVEATGFARKLKLLLANIFAKVLGWFG